MHHTTQCALLAERIGLALKRSEITQKARGAEAEEEEKKWKEIKMGQLLIVLLTVKRCKIISASFCLFFAVANSAFTSTI